jgi:hypothetical protein
MQEALPVFVLHSEVSSHYVMNDTPTTPEKDAAGKPSSDEQLMLAFSKGSAEAFSELFGPRFLERQQAMASLRRRTRRTQKYCFAKQLESWDARTGRF